MFPFDSYEFAVHRFSDMRKDEAPLHKRPRTTVECFEADSSNAELGREESVATQAVRNEGDMYGEIIGQRIIMPYSMFF